MEAEPIALTPEQINHIRERLKIINHPLVAEPVTLYKICEERERFSKIDATRMGGYIGEIIRDTKHEWIQFLDALEENLQSK